MRTESRIIYTAAELKKEKPEAFEKAIQHYRDNKGNAAWTDDICKSGRETVKAAGLTLTDWMVDEVYPSQSFYKVEGFGEDQRGNDNGGLTGRKAREWLRRAFGPKVSINFRGREPGNCPFTGYCADDDCIDALKKSIHDGETLKQAFENLGYVVAKICESESEYEATEAYFLDHADANGWEYDENGERI